MNGFVLILVLLLFFFLQGMIVSLFALKGLRYTRSFAQKTAFEGDETQLVEVLRNDRMLFVPWLRAESRISPYLRFGSQDNLSVKAERYHKSVFTLYPFQQLTRKHKVHLTHRGVYDTGNVSLTAGDLLGFRLKNIQLYEKAEIIVYPRLLPEENLPLPVTRLMGDMTVRRHYIADPFFVNGIRPYHPGDPVRDIHWGATAKTSQLQVKTHDYTADTRLMIMLNCQMSENQWGDLMDYEEDLIEYAISLAATVSLYVLRFGVPVGFSANMPFDKGEKCAYVPCESGRERADGLLEAYARLTVKRVRNFPSFLDDFEALTGTDVLILTPYTSDEIEKRARLLRQRGNTVTIHLIGGEDSHA